MTAYLDYLGLTASDYFTDPSGDFFGSLGEAWLSGEEEPNLSDRQYNNINFVKNMMYTMVRCNFRFQITDLGFSCIVNMARQNRLVRRKLDKTSTAIMLDILRLRIDWDQVILTNNRSSRCNSLSFSIRSLSSNSLSNMYR